MYVIGLFLHLNGNKEWEITLSDDCCMCTFKLRTNILPQILSLHVIHHPLNFRIWTLGEAQIIQVNWPSWRSSDFLRSSGMPVIFSLLFFFSLFFFFPCCFGFWFCFVLFLFHASVQLYLTSTNVKCKTGVIRQSSVWFSSRTLSPKSRSSANGHRHSEEPQTVWFSGVPWGTPRASSSLSGGCPGLPWGVRAGPGSQGLSTPARSRASLGGSPSPGPRTPARGGKGQDVGGNPGQAQGGEPVPDQSWDGRAGPWGQERGEVGPGRVAAPWWDG